MRKILFVASMLVVPGSAVAQAIAGSPHDLSMSNGTAGVLHSTVQGQICVFCHTPHGADGTTNAIWNKTLSTTAAYGGWGVTATVAGTALPTSVVSGGSLKCFSCHDGTTDVGAIRRGTSTTAGQWANNTGPVKLDATGHMDAANPHRVSPANMAGNHPVAIPYPGVTGNTTGTTYNGITSGVTAAGLAGFQSIAAAEGAGIIFYGGPTERRGIECGSCHDPHKYSATQPFLHLANNGSLLCLACHNK